MPLDARAKRFLEKLAAVNPPGILTLNAQDRREGLRELLRFAGPTEAVTSIEHVLVPGPQGAIALRAYQPAGIAPGHLPGLIYFHGGGLVAGDLDTHDPICRALTNASGCRVLSVDYRLGPEHRFPAALEDGCAATRWIAANAEGLGVNPRQLGICGDSAGATLAAVVCREVSQPGTVALAFQFLLCPITDFAAESDSRRNFAQGYLVDRDTLAHDLRLYLGADADPSDPRISPLRAGDLRGLPPAVIHTAEFDPLRDEGHAYAERLRSSGVATLYRCHPGMIHLFYGMRGLIPYAGTAFAQMGTDIRSLLTEPERHRG
jgi:acetyl esterase